MTELCIWTMRSIIFDYPMAKIIKKLDCTKLKTGGFKNEHNTDLGIKSLISDAQFQKHFFRSSWTSSYQFWRLVTCFLSFMHSNHFVIFSFSISFSFFIDLTIIMLPNLDYAYNLSVVVVQGIERHVSGIRRVSYSYLCRFMVKLNGGGIKGFLTSIPHGNVL